MLVLFISYIDKEFAIPDFENKNGAYHDNQIFIGVFFRTVCIHMYILLQKWWRR